MWTKHSPCLELEMVTGGTSPRQGTDQGKPESQALLGDPGMTYRLLEPFIKIRHGTHPPERTVVTGGDGTRVLPGRGSRSWKSRCCRWHACVETRIEVSDGERLRVLPDVDWKSDKSGMVSSLGGTEFVKAEPVPIEIVEGRMLLVIDSMVFMESVGDPEVYMSGIVAEGSSTSLENHERLKKDKINKRLTK